jgi:hypothetical protein
MQILSCAGVVFLGCILAGCASYNSQEAAVEEAWQEKEAAYIRLAKAITSYCSVSTETMDDRQTCILERRLSVLRSESGQQGVPSSPAPSYLRSAR